MKTNSHSPVTEMLSAKYKIWLTVGLAAVTLADFVVCICLWADGVPGAYWLFPFIFALVDGLYLLGVIFSNQRFSYALKMFVTYAGVTLLEIIIWTVTLAAGDDVVFVNVSAALWAAIHVIGLIAATVAYLYASKRFKFAHAAQLTIAIVAAVVAALLMLLYMISLAATGFFGQGNGLRPLIYAEAEDGSGYIVTGVMNGKGDTAAVPKEFNDKKVVAVSYKVFRANGLKRVNLDCDGDTLFTDVLSLSDDTGASLSYDITITAPIETADIFRQTFYADAAHSSLSEAYKRFCFALGNNVTPVVPDDEVFVTFDYSYDSYLAADQNVIPTWHGKKNDTFEASYFDDITYAVRSNNVDDYDLYWNYDHNQHIMHELKIGDKPIVGSRVTASANVEVSFDRVYKVFPGATNDTKYDVTSVFPYSVVKDVVQKYKLTVAEHADEILSDFKRDGFSVRWRYATGALDNVEFQSLGEVLSGYDKDVETFTVSPVWALDNPIVNIKSTDDESTVVYGDPFTLTAEASHTLGDAVEYRYLWYKDNNGFAEGAEWTTASMPFDGGGEYRVAVAATVPEITSVSSSAVVWLNVTVARRELQVEWTDPEGAVDGHITYNNENHTVTPALYNALSADNVYVNISSFSYEDAGAHECKVILAGAQADRYYIKSGDEKHTLTIDPFEVDVRWDNVENGKVEFTYNGKKQAPEAHSSAQWGPSNVTILDVEVTGEQINANVSGGTYTATARIIKYRNLGVGNIEDTNYKIKSGKTQTFVINPLEVNVVWGDTTSFEYDGNPHAPTARANGEENGTGGYKELIMNVGGAEVNAGADYTATASHASANYAVSESTRTKPFTVMQKPITIDWSSTALTYSGDEQSPVPSAVGANGAPLSFAVTGGQVDAGFDYTATAELTSALDKRNYDVVNPERAYNILPREITVVWEGYTLTYNGAVQKPNARATGVKNRNLPVNVTAQGGDKVNAGTYVAVVTFANTVDLNNYTISNQTREFTIRKRDAAAVWGNRSFEYNGKDQQPTATVVGINGEITVIVSVTEAEHVNVGGNYHATASAVDSLDIQNYNITNNATTFSIYAKALTVKVNNATVEYGETPVYSYAATGFVGTDESGVTVSFGVDYAADGEGHIPSGTYAITATVTGDASSNYVITVTPGILTVKAKPTTELDG